jgi:hypothetical protein
MRLGDGTVVVTEPPVHPTFQEVTRPRPTRTLAVPTPGPPGKDAEVVLEGEFNYTHVQTELETLWVFQNPLGRNITSCRVIYPTTPEGETVWTLWDTSADGKTVTVDNKYPATGRAIIS